MYSLLVYNENHIQTIQYTKSGRASLFEAVSTKQKDKNTFCGQSEAGNSNSSGTASLRVSAQGLVWILQ